MTLDTKTDRWTEKQSRWTQGWVRFEINMHSDTSASRQTVRQTHINGLTNRHSCTDIWTARQADIKLDRWRFKYTDLQMERQTDI